MTTFAYQARDPLGHMTSGSLDVESRDDAVSRLKRDGLTIVELMPDQNLMLVRGSVPGPKGQTVEVRTDA